ncbi:Gar1/Naf1 RNA binding region-domain-containing protein [Aspergillus karnatakaensis]|uniref:RNA-binding snoRNP assembly protein NAF1 n=1 Tax=Aspergillus karnatakaensis TaxID=1810916 RepID=UPI003CCD9D87
MAEPNNQNIPANAAEGVPVNTLPTTAQTLVDDGSDFYNTPQAAGTPAEAAKKLENNVATNVTEASVSNPPPQIPGLSLVNDKPQESQSGTNPAESTNNADTTITGTKGETQAPVLEAKPQGSEVPTQPNTDAMEVEQDKTQPLESTAPVENAQTNGSTNGAVAAAAEAAPAQTEQQEEEEEHPEWELDSSPYESSSDDSTDSSDSDDEDEDYPILSPEEQARILMSGELGSDDEGEGKGKAGVPLKTANEVPEEVLPIPEVTITPEMKIVLLGNVEAAVENTVLIAANVTGEYQVLEAGSLLCLEDRRVAGVVSETLGRVENPLYAVRFPTAADVESHGLARGTTVYYVEQHSTFVFTQPLKGLKGSDASNFHDEEVAEDEVEFSDDEQEAEYRRKLKQKRQERKGGKGDNAAGKGRGPPGPSKLGQSELNYDDNAAEDGYTPLARPKNLHEMMRQEAPVESDGFSGRHSGRGRGRGNDRGGRGSRGRGRGGRDHHGHGHGHHSQHDSQPHYQQERDAPQHQHHQPQPQQYPPYNQPQHQHQQYPSYPPQTQPQPQQPYPQAALPTTPFNFQMPYQQAYQQQAQAYQQPNPYGQMPNAPHINPLFLAALQQQQQYQQQQQQQQPGAAQPQAQAQAPNQAMNFDQVKAQLDLLRQLSGGGGQWPPQQ